MKGKISGVQKLIKDEIPSIYNVGLADLAIKAGVKTLPVNVDQLFIIIFITAAKEARNLLTFGNPCLALNLRPSKALSDSMVKPSALCEAVSWSAVRAYILFSIL